MADRKRVAIIAGVTAAVVALFSIPLTRRLIGATLVSLFVLAGWVDRDTTERHCDAFAEAYEVFDHAFTFTLEPSDEELDALAESTDTMREEMRALADPPEGEIVDTAVSRTALRVLFFGGVFATAEPSAEILDSFARLVDTLLAACAAATE